MSAGKGDKPRNCFSAQFKNNYDEINWGDSKDDSAISAPHLEELLDCFERRFNITKYTKISDLGGFDFKKLQRLTNKYQIKIRESDSVWGVAIKMYNFRPF